MRPPRVPQLPDRRPILIATKVMLFRGQDTNHHNKATKVAKMQAEKSFFAASL
jgi:hypothetical protein